ALLCWNVMPAVAAEPDKEKPPAIILRLSSFRDLIGDINYVASLEKQEKAAKGLEEWLEGFTGKDHGGIDIKRPVALYGLADPNGLDLQPLLSIPVAEKRLFISFVERYAGDLEWER